MSAVSDEARAAYDAGRFYEWAVEEPQGLIRLLDEHERMEERLELLEASQPEYEYGSAGYCFDDDYNDRRCYYTDSSLKKVLKHERDWHGGNASRPVRRVKAGPWEKVD